MLGDGGTTREFGPSLQFINENASFPPYLAKRLRLVSCSTCVVGGGAILATSLYPYLACWTRSVLNGQDNSSY